MSTEIGPGAYTEIHYSLRDGRGNLLEETDEGPFGFIFGMEQVVPGLERALEGARAGDTLNVMVPPEDAYGTRDPSNVFDADREELPDAANVIVGTEFTAEGEDGTELSMRVLEVHEDHVVVDANHPLAGETLNFQVQVVVVRAATTDEILAAQAQLAETRPAEGES